MAAELGFEALCTNSLDAVSDRDFAVEFTAAAALTMTHVSRFAEELAWWTNPRFAFVALADRFCTGSSIMPQKKNPDVAELARGKTGRVNGHLVALLTLMKGQPLAYNRDNQEDKEPLFDTVDTLADTLAIMTDLVAGGITVDAARMREAAAEGHATATDLADYLVRKGVPFRDAHEAVARAVRHAGATRRRTRRTCRSPTCSRSRREIGADVLRGADARRLGREPRPSRAAPAPDQVRAAIAAARARWRSTHRSSGLTPVSDRRTSQPNHGQESPDGTRNVAFLGLGVMGYPMAGHLARAGHHVTVYNRTPAKASRWLAQHPGKSAPTPAAAVAGADLVLMCVGNDDDVRAVVFGGRRRARGDAAGVDPRRPHDRVRADRAGDPRGGGRPGASAFSTRRCRAARPGAENGKLTIMVGGDADLFARAEPVLAHYGRAVTLMGGPGSGQLTKMFNQICIAGLVQALAEGIAFAEKAGLDVAARPRGDQQGRGAVVADGKSRQDDGRRQVRLRLRRRLDAQGPGALPRRGARAGAPRYR